MLHVNISHIEFRFLILTNFLFSMFTNFIKETASKSDRDDFLSEAAILGQFKDPNVISLEGVILKGNVDCGFPERYCTLHDVRMDVHFLFFIVDPVDVQSILPTLLESQKISKIFALT